MMSLRRIEGSCKGGREAVMAVSLACDTFSHWRRFLLLYRPRCIDQPNSKD
jgi:hypothetical protein